MASPEEDDDINPRPPGQQRPYPPPTKTGHIAFTPPGTTLQCHTHYSLYGSLEPNAPNAEAKPPLVCIYGGPGATSFYMRPFSLLSIDYSVPVILYDQLGCGESTRLRDKKGDTKFWTLDLFVAELRNLLESLQIKTVDLLGHSWGACVAVRFAAQQPQQQKQPPNSHHPANRISLRKLTIAQSTASLSARTPFFRAQMESLPPPHGPAATLAHRTHTTDPSSNPSYASALKSYSHHHICRLSPLPPEFLESMAAMSADDTVASTFALSGDEDSYDILPDIRVLDGGVLPPPGGGVVGF